MLIQDLYYVATLPFRVLRELPFDVYVLSDKTKRITYITSSSVGPTPYFVERICCKDATMTKVKRIYAWELRKFANRQDAVLIDMPRLLSFLFDDGFLVPPFVRQVLDIDGPVDNIIKINSKNLRRVYKYNYEVSNDENMLKFFYDKMYVPHMKRRYGDSAVEDFSHIEKIFKNGELLLIKHDGKCVSAQLCEIDGDSYFLRKNGVLDESFVEDGALVATYYFGTMRAKERNAKIVDFGRSRPFLSDGVLRHKSLWGTRICDDKAVKRIIYLRNVLFEQPFIYVENEKLKAVVFSENDKLIKEYTRSGLEFSTISEREHNEGFGNDYCETVVN